MIALASDCKVDTSDCNCCIGKEAIATSRVITFWKSVENRLVPLNRVLPVLVVVPVSPVLEVDIAWIQLLDYVGDRVQMARSLVVNG